MRAPDSSLVPQQPLIRTALSSSCEHGMLCQLLETPFLFFPLPEHSSFLPWASGGLLRAHKRLPELPRLSHLVQSPDHTSQAGQFWVGGHGPRRLVCTRVPPWPEAEAWTCWARSGTKSTAGWQGLWSETQEEEPTRHAQGNKLKMQTFLQQTLGNGSCTQDPYLESWAGRAGVGGHTGVLCNHQSAVSPQERPLSSLGCQGGLGDTAAEGPLPPPRTSC